MKKLHLIIIVIILSACCQTKEKNKINTVIITGTIENAKADFVTIKSQSEEESIPDSAFLDTNGYFMLKINMANADYYTFKHGHESANLFLIPGDSIYLTLNTEKFDESLKFEGKGAEINNFLIRKFLLNEKIEMEAQQLYSLEEDEFIAKTDSVNTVLKNHLDKFLNSNKNIHKKFANLEQAKLLYLWANKRIRYPRIYKYYTKKDTIELGEDYDNYISQLNLNDSNLIGLIEYTSFLQNYINKQANEELEKDTSRKEIDNAFVIAKFGVALKIFTALKVKDYILYSILSEQIRYSGITGIDDLISEFKKNCSNKEYQIKIKELYKEWKVLAKGMPAPDFSYPDINKNMVSLSDFKGKYVYIDVWASWCGPCRKEIPYFEQLKEDFKYKNIVFISVSVDDTKEPWEKMVKEEEMKGIQLFAKGWQSDIAKNYIIHSIPRFILIDKEVKIIDVNAPRPSGEIKEVLENLDGMEL